MNEFENQIAVVTGGAQGIGRAVAERLSAGGARVAIWDRDTSPLLPARKAIQTHQPIRRRRPG